MRKTLARWLGLQSQHPSEAPAPVPAAPELRPVGSADSLQTLQELGRHQEVKAAESLEKALLQEHSQAEGQRFHYTAHCAACGGRRPLLVDTQWGGLVESAGWRPNWRERLECAACGMNNRQRLMVALIQGWATHHPGGRLYLMEQVTPIFLWADQTLAASHALSGSEYLGPQYSSGETVQGVRHEDIERLSFEAGSLDLIVSNDVFEHVPDPWQAFRECRRVLRTGGLMLATIPFYDQENTSRPRARLCAAGIKHLLPAQYHGNPVSVDGSLVFTDFGWDVIHQLHEAGFASALIDAYVSTDRGHLGGMQLVLRATT